MSNLKDIKHRINNVGLVEKVTVSMQSVSAAKLNQARRHYANTQDYFYYNNLILQYLLLNMQKKGAQAHSVLYNLACTTQNHLPKLVFVIGADRGLCGALNSNLTKYAQAHINTLKLNKQDFLIVTIGKRIQHYFKEHYKEQTYTLPYTLDITTFGVEQTMLIANYIYNMIIENNIGSVDFIYTHYISVLETLPIVKQVFPLPLTGTSTDNQETKVDELNIVTDDKFIGEVLENLIKDIILVDVQRAILNSLTSEYSARVNAMESAVNNSKELLHTLSLEYNRTRQSNITKELIEIISGNEALKE